MRRVVASNCCWCRCGCAKVGGGTLSKIDGGAPSHLTQKCLRSVAHKFVISGVNISSLSYHLSAMLPAPRWQASDLHFSSSV